MEVEAPGKPAYQQIADDLRKAIADGHLAVGEPVGSTAQLMARYRVSSTVARKAVDQLRAEGLVIGRPGKGVYVRTTPAEAAAEAPTLIRLAEEIQELRQAMDLSGSQRFAQLEDRVAHLEAQVMDICANIGMPYQAGRAKKKAAEAG